MGNTPRLGTEGEDAPKARRKKSNPKYKMGRLKTISASTHIDDVQNSGDK